MSLVGEEMECAVKAVNVGIDAHLEACFIPDRGDKYERVVRRTVTGVAHTTALDCVVSSESLPVLLRRLSEQDDEKGLFLADNILDCIGLGSD